MSRDPFNEREEERSSGRWDNLIDTLRFLRFELFIVLYRKIGAQLHISIN
jgi:hypothetical protein